jgi:hypothetical protein
MLARFFCFGSCWRNFFVAGAFFLFRLLKKMLAQFFNAGAFFLLRLLKKCWRFFLLRRVETRRYGVFSQFKKLKHATTLLNKK